MASHLDLEEQEQLEQLKAFWKRWGNLITTGVTVVLVAFAAWNGWNWWQREQGAKAMALYEQLQDLAETQDKDADKMAAAFAVLKERFGSTAAAAQGGLLVAKVQHDKQQDDAARTSLAWVAEHGIDAAYRDVAQLRLAALQIDVKQYDAASKALDAVKSAEFAELVADRRGDLALLQKNADVAKTEYLKAYKAMDAKLDYRRLVEAKLASLGVAGPADEAAKEASK